MEQRFHTVRRILSGIIASSEFLPVLIDAQSELAAKLRTTGITVSTINNWLRRRGYFLSLAVQSQREFYYAKLEIIRSLPHYQRLTRSRRNSI